MPFPILPILAGMAASTAMGWAGHKVAGRRLDDVEQDIFSRDPKLFRDDLAVVEQRTGKKFSGQAAAQAVLDYRMSDKYGKEYERAKMFTLGDDPNSKMRVDLLDLGADVATGAGLAKMGIAPVAKAGLGGLARLFGREALESAGAQAGMTLAGNVADQYGYGGAVRTLASLGGGLGGSLGIHAVPSITRGLRAGVKAARATGSLSDTVVSEMKRALSDPNTSAATRSQYLDELKKAGVSVDEAAPAVGKAVADNPAQSMSPSEQRELEDAMGYLGKHGPLERGGMIPDRSPRTLDNLMEPQHVLEKDPRALYAEELAGKAMPLRRPAPVLDIAADTGMRPGMGTLPVPVTTDATDSILALIEQKARGKGGRKPRASKGIPAPEPAPAPQPAVDLDALKAQAMAQAQTEAPGNSLARVAELREKAKALLKSHPERTSINPKKFYASLGKQTGESPAKLRALFPPEELGKIGQEVRAELANPGIAPGSPIYFAGIGSRETPAEVLETMREISSRLNNGENGWHLRSGGAPGADQAFESGAQGARSIYLPWDNFEGHRAGVSGAKLLPLEEAEKIAMEHHPAWKKLKPGARKLMARNTFQVLGDDLKTPSNVVIAYAPLDAKGNPTGGTAQAIRIAKAKGIPVINLAERPLASAEDIAEEARRLVAGGSKAQAAPVAAPVKLTPKERYNQWVKDIVMESTPDSRAKNVTPDGAGLEKTRTDSRMVDATLSEKDVRRAIKQKDFENWPGDSAPTIDHVLDRLNNVRKPVRPNVRGGDRAPVRALTQAEVEALPPTPSANAIKGDVTREAIPGAREAMKSELLVQREALAKQLVSELDAEKQKGLLDQISELNQKLSILTDKSPASTPKGELLADKIPVVEEPPVQPGRMIPADKPAPLPKAGSPERRAIDAFRQVIAKAAHTGGSGDGIHHMTQILENPALMKQAMADLDPKLRKHLKVDQAKAELQQMIIETRMWRQARGLDKATPMATVPTPEGGKAVNAAELPPATAVAKAGAEAPRSPKITKQIEALQSELDQIQKDLDEGRIVDPRDEAASEWHMEQPPDELMPVEEAMERIAEISKKIESLKKADGGSVPGSAAVNGVVAGGAPAPGGDTALGRFAVAFKKAFTDPHADIPTQARRAIYAMEDAKAVDRTDLKRMVDGLRDIKRRHGISDELLETFWKNGDGPEELKALRNRYIDKITPILEQAKAEGLLKDADPTHIVRSYRLFEQKPGTWQPDEELYKAAAERLVADKKAPDLDKAMAMLDDILAKGARGMDDQVKLNLDRAYKRHDIPDEIRAFMGEIKDPVYGLYKNYKNWTESMNLLRMQKRLVDEGMGQWISDAPKAGWVKLDPRIARASKMATGIDVDRMGPLSGKWVSPEVAGLLKRDMKEAGDTWKAYKVGLSLWKTMKVPFSMSTQAVNAMGNSWLCHMGGMGLADQAEALPAAFREVIGDIKGKPSAWVDLAKKNGVIGKHFLYEDVDILAETMAESMKLKTGSPFLKTMVAIRDGLDRSPLGKLSDAYGMIEDSYRLMLFKHYMENGIDPGMGSRAFAFGSRHMPSAVEAAEEVNRVLFDYSRVPGAVDLARNSFMPFITFPYKYAQSILYNAKHHPIHTFTSFAVMGAVHEAAKQAGYDVDFTRMIPGLNFVTPNEFDKDKSPAEKLVEPFKPSGPLMWPAEVAMNRSTFTGKEIYPEDGTWGQKAAGSAKYVYNQAVPSLFGYGGKKLLQAFEDTFGTPNPKYAKRSLPLTALEVFLGIKLTPRTQEAWSGKQKSVAGRIRSEVARFNSYRNAHADDEAAVLKRLEEMRANVTKLRQRYQELEEEKRDLRP